MRIKLDENLPLALQSGLGALEHDVHSVFDENLAGEPDDKIWHACTVEERFLITQDLDFSDARKYPPGTHAGIVILRVADDSRENLTRVVLRAFADQGHRGFRTRLGCSHRRQNSHPPTVVSALFQPVKCAAYFTGTHFRPPPVSPYRCHRCHKW